MIRVLVAEDSPTARALLVGILSSEPGLEVIGQAVDGIEVVAMTKSLKPDIITMDIQMPGLDGFQATQQIMVEAPTPIVIISSLDVGTVQFSMDALKAGALAVLPKPVGPASPDFEDQRRYLVGMVRAMSQVKLVRRWAHAPPYRMSTGPQGIVAPERAPMKPKIVAIAASTGGPAAYHRIFSALPKDFPLPIVFVQHIALGFGEGFARWLDDACKISVRLARAGDSLLPGVAYLAPDDRHLGVSERQTLTLSDGPPIGGFRPSANHLFESVSKVFGGATVAAILTGMGSDGTEGLRTLRAASAKIIAQDEATSDIFGMPGVAIAAGVVDIVLPLDSIAGQLERWTRS